MIKKVPDYKLRPNIDYDQLAREAEKLPAHLVGQVIVEASIRAYVHDGMKKYGFSNISEEEIREDAMESGRTFIQNHSRKA